MDLWILLLDNLVVFFFSPLLNIYLFWNCLILSTFSGIVQFSTVPLWSLNSSKSCCHNLTFFLEISSWSCFFFFFFHTVRKPDSEPEVCGSADGEESADVARAHAGKDANWFQWISISFVAVFVTLSCHSLLRTPKFVVGTTVRCLGWRKEEINNCRTIQFS